MDIDRQDIEKRLKKYELIDKELIFNDLQNIYSVNDKSSEYVLKSIINTYCEKNRQLELIYQKRRDQLSVLKQLELPEQRSKEWYEMRKNKLTASSLADALDKGHFQSRDELLFYKIEEKPFEPNPITEWGVKYEDVAIKCYEQLYKVKVHEFGLIPHPDFEAFGASPDGICDDTGNDPYIGRMVEIKCPPKRKFTKTVPPHYLMQVQGQLEVCDLDECDFFQVKIEEYENYEDYCKDIFEIDGVLQHGRTSLNFPKGVTITYKRGEKLSYKYCNLDQSDEELKEWIQGYEEKDISEDIFEIKWWKITRYECTLVHRDRVWWYETIDKILLFYKDLLMYRSNSEELSKLKNRITNSKKRRKRIEVEPLIDFQLISDDEGA